MYLKFKISLFFFISTIHLSVAQIDNLFPLFNLPVQLKETSGLLYFNDKLISHNDKGDDANLYEIDIETGEITRTITIENATNVDWEDISQDNDYIYIGDFGNNTGNRQDLKVYRISKSEFVENTSVMAELIHFSYEDQTDFNENQFTNFDAEAMVIYNNNILIFTKNRGDFKTNVYRFSKSIGTHLAIKTDSYNSEGLITGATYNVTENCFFLSGYAINSVYQLEPFVLYIANMCENNLFCGTVEKTDITSLIGLGSQIEGITVFEDNQYYISREGNSSHIQAVFSFESLYTILENEEHNKPFLTILPNPTESYVSISLPASTEVLDANLYTVLGKNTGVRFVNGSLNLSNLAKGTYYLKLTTPKEIFTKKIIKK